MNDQKNLIFFIIIFIAVMVGWQYFYEAPKPPAQTQTQQQVGSAAAIPTAAAKPIILDRKEVLSASSRVHIDTPSLRGSINLKGGALDDLTLEKYRGTTNKNSP